MLSKINTSINIYYVRDHLVGKSLWCFRADLPRGVDGADLVFTLDLFQQKLHRAEQPGTFCCVARHVTFTASLGLLFYTPRNLKHYQ